MLCDPVLAFIKAFRLRGSADNLKRAALSKFDSVLLCKAKKELWDSVECKSTLHDAGLSFRSRRVSEKRSQAMADLEDLICAFDKFDELDKIPEIFCEATDLVTLPPIVIDDCTAIVQQNNDSLELIKSKLNTLSDSISVLQSKLDKSKEGASTYAACLSRASPSPTLNHTAPFEPRSLNLHRKENLIIFGLEEQSMTSTMESVQKMLNFLLGRTTVVKDLFRIGRFKKPNAEQSSPSRPRPVILKLSSPWDRRLVLSSRFNLKNYEVKGIFVREDLSPEERKLREQNRIKSSFNVDSSDQSLDEQPASK